MTEIQGWEENLPEEVGQLREADYARVLKYIGHSISPNTHRVYETHLKGFTDFCAKRRWSPLPATEGAVIAYLTWVCSEDHAPKPMRPSSARAIKSAISVAHDNANHPNPTRGRAVKNALANLDREHQGGWVKRARPMVTEEITAATAHLGDSPVDLRDKAIIMLGFGAALRRSEIVALNVEDFEVVRGRTRVRVRRSKTDQTGKGAVVPIPKPAAEAVSAWLATAGITSGAVFRRMQKSKVGRSRLTGQSVAIIVQDRAGHAGLGAGWSGHSLRRGAATEAVANGADQRKLKRLGRWRSSDAADLYVDDAALDMNPDEILGFKSQDSRTAEETQ